MSTEPTGERRHSQTAYYDDGRVIVEPRSGQWVVYVVNGTTRARIAAYTARYRALRHAAALAGHDDDYSDL